ncbi:MAG TPA: glycosyltransferase family 9 protein [Ignavibacteriaceae bacterium]
MLVTPVIRAIKKKYPVLQIDFLLKNEYLDILKNNPHLNKIFGYVSDSSEMKSLISKLKEQQYDLVIDLQNNFRSRKLTGSIGKPVVKFKKKNYKKFLLVNFKINLLKDALSIPERYAEAIEGLTLDAEGLEIYSEKKNNPSLLDGKMYIGLCPGSKHFTKRWPKEYYLELGNLLEQSGYAVVLFGGSDDLALCSEISVQLKNAINLCNENNLLQTAADMKMCKLIYCNDSGLMHLATAVKVPVITFFGSTVKEFGFFPYKTKNTVLQIENLKCRPCTHIGRKSCPEKHFKCLNDITPQTAFAGLKEYTR